MQVTAVAILIMFMLNVVRPAIIGAKAKAWRQWITEHYPFTPDSPESGLTSNSSLSTEAWSSLMPGAGHVRILTFGSYDGFLPCTLAKGQ